MIVRDAAEFIEETLALALPFVDTWLIVDTGSVDSTREVVMQFFTTSGMSGSLVERPWVGFAHNRTEALQLAGEVADFALMVDADDLIIGAPQIREAAASKKHPAYLAQFGPHVIFLRPALFDLSHQWEFRGTVHEYAVCIDSSDPLGRLDGEYHFVFRSLGGRSKDAQRFERDIAALEIEHDADPTNTRSVFYLGQSHRDAGNQEKAMHFYKMRADMDGWEEEKYVAALEYARLLERTEAAEDAIVAAYELAHAVRPTRAEALYSLARFHRLAGRWADGYEASKRVLGFPEPADLLFMERDVYAWKIADECALCAFYLGHFDESLAINEELLWNPQVPFVERTRILSNKGYSLSNLRTDSSHSMEREYSEISLVTLDGSNGHEVTMTVTTCRRRELFERTMDSFLSQCTDTHLITRWICIDDGSSSDDQRLMQERYPFFEFIFKSPSERGHVHSMNRLLYEVGSTYWLHLEDDWEFITRGPHISRAIHVLESDHSLVQVVLNKNYAENMDYCDVVGGDVRLTPNGIPYRTHAHLPHGSPGLAQLMSDNPGKLTSAHWPGFSLMPCLIHRNRITPGGAFNPGAGHFEFEMALKLHEHGRRTAFFDDLIMLSLGKLRTDNSPDAPQNAYALNGTTQFRNFENTPVDIVANWSDGTSIASLWSRQFCGGRPWFGASLASMQEQAERHLVVNMPSSEVAIDLKSSYLVHMEPNEGIERYGEWSNPDPSRLAHFRSRRIAMNPFEWHLDCTFDELTTSAPAKSKDLSTVVSAKRFSTGHHLRLDFVHRLKKEGIPIDVWGQGLDVEFADHRGSLPWMDKRDGLFPYRYTIAVENNSEPNYATEKIVDAILSECLTFYWGCPNLGEVIDEEAFIRLPLDDFDAAVEIVRRTIATDEYSRRLPAIRQAKRDILNKHHIAPMLGRFVAGEKFVNALDLHVINLDQRPDRLESFFENFSRVAGQPFVGRIKRFSAVDGKDIELTDEILRIFRGSELPLRRNQTACALSHLALWYETANGDGTPALIFEDDVAPDPDFIPRLIEVAGQLVESSWNGDVVFLDLSYFDDAKRPFQFHQATCEIDESIVMGGTSAYLISAQGAQKLLTIAHEEGIAFGIDTFILRNMHRINCVQATPSLTRAPVARRGGDIVDSDIQYSTDTL